MAVPKQKQSHARTNKRRSTAQDLRAGDQRVPAVPPAAPPASGLPALRLLRRARGRARARRPRSRPRPLGRPAGDDRGQPIYRRASTPTAPTSAPPRSRAAPRSAAARRASACCCSGRPGAIDAGPTASRSSTRRSRSPRRPTRRAPCARRPTPRSCAPSQAVADGPRRRARLRRLDRRGARRRRCSTSSAPAASTARRSRCWCPCPARPFLLLDAGANVEVRPEHLVQFAHMGAAFMEVVLGVERPRVALLSNGEEPSKGTEDVVAAHARAAPRAARAATSSATSRASRSARARPTSSSTDGFTGNVALKVMEGTAAALLGAVRDAAHVHAAREGSAGCCCARRCAGCATSSTPRRQGGAVLLGLRRLGVVPHGSFGARGFARADRASPRAACARTSSGAPTPPWRRRARCGAAPAPSAAAASVPDDHDPRRGPRADPRAPGRRAASSIPARVEESTHFKEDLEADSLDLYTLVQELEDTYGVRMTDEQAAQIQTVGQAVDFVLAHAPPQPSATDRPERSSHDLLDALPEDLARQAVTHASWTEQPRGLLRAPRASWATPCSRSRSPRTCTRGWTPSATAPAADQDPRAGGLGPLLPGGRRAARAAGAPAGGGAGRVAPAAPEALVAHRARARLGDRGGHRRVLPRLRLRADGRGGGRGVRAGDRAGARAAGRLQVGAAGAARAPRGARGLRR